MLISGTPGGQLAMVVFVDHTDCAWLRPLKRGFRHCFVALEHPTGWLVCDSLKTHMELVFIELPGLYELSECYAQQGHHVLIGRIEASGSHILSPFTPLTCVSVAKRALAIRAGWVWTPWQLFQHLLNVRPQSWLLVPRCEQSDGCVTEDAIGA